MKAVDQILEHKDIRITPMRQLLLAHFLGNQTILGLQELEKAFPKSDRITIYRTLKTFEENGIVHAIDNGTSEVKYALCREHCTPAQHIDQHPHFHCINCGKILCLETVYIPSIELPAGFSSTEISMTIKGICDDC